MTADENQSGGVLVQLDDTALHNAKLWYNNFKKYVTEVLKKDTDYGIVAGVWKPTLLKPWAEKLRLVFGLQVKMEKTTETLDIDRDYYDVNYLCSILDRDGRVIGQCEGGTTTQEDKYLYRYQLRDADKNPSKEEAEELKAKKQGRRKKIQDKRRREDKEIADNKIGNKNTLQKMAQKRAYVGAVLIATWGSEFFTQDVEDMANFNVIDAEVVPATTSPASTPASAPAQTATPTWLATEKQIGFLESSIKKCGFKNVERIIQKLIDKNAPWKKKDTITSVEASAIIKRAMTKTTILEDTGTIPAEETTTPAPAVAPTSPAYDDNDDLPF